MQNSFVMSSVVVSGNCPPRGLGGQFHPSFGDCFALRPTSATHMSPIQEVKNKCPPRGPGGQFGPLWGASGEALERLWEGSGEGLRNALCTLCAHVAQGPALEAILGSLSDPRWLQNVKHSSKSGVREEPGLINEREAR